MIQFILCSRVCRVIYVVDLDPVIFRSRSRLFLDPDPDLFFHPDLIMTEQGKGIRARINKVILCSIVRGVLGDPEVTANINCKSRNLANIDTRNHSTDLR